MAEEEKRPDYKDVLHKKCGGGGVGGGGKKTNTASEVEDVVDVVAPSEEDAADTDAADADADAAEAEANAEDVSE